MEDDNSDEPSPFIFGPEVDLHHFHPRDTAAVIEEFLRQAVEAGYDRVRIVHGKGGSVKKREVLELLGKHPEVIQVKQDGPNWGATVVLLKK